MLKAILAILYAELLLLLRQSQEWIYPLIFFGIIITLFPFALTPDPHVLQTFMPGCIWIAALLASLLSIETIFLTDVEDGNIEQLLLSNIPLTLLVSIKLAAKWIVTQLPLVILTPVFGLLFHLSFFTVIILCVSLLLSTPILTLLGSVGVALTLGLRQQGVLLGLLILPLIIPILIFSVNIVQQAQAGFSVGGPLAFLTGLLLLAITLLPWTIAQTLRISVDD